MSGSEADDEDPKMQASSEVDNEARMGIEEYIARRSPRGDGYEPYGEKLALGRDDIDPRWLLLRVRLSFAFCAIMLIRMAFGLMISPDGLSGSNIAALSFFLIVLALIIIRDIRWLRELRKLRVPPEMRPT